MVAKKAPAASTPSMSGRAPQPVALISGMMSAMGSPHWLKPPKGVTVNPEYQQATARFGSTAYTMRAPIMKTPWVKATCVAGA